MLKKLILLVKHFLSNFKTKLPTGTKEFQAWINSITELSGPLADQRSMEFVVASALLHYDLPRGDSGGYMPKRYFVNRLYHSAACQLAHYKFQEIKIAQAEEAEAAKKAEIAKQSVAVTTQTQESVVPDAHAVPQAPN